jgi:gliding motility-associated-like protein
MSVSSNTFSSSCSSVPDGSISLTPTGGVASYSFTWQGPKGFIASTQNLNNIFSGSYSVVVTDNLGCKKTNTLQVVPTITIVAKAGFDATICPNTGTVLLDGNNSSGSANFKWYKLSDPTNTIAATNSIVIGNLTDPEIYVLVATASISTCIDRDTVKVNLFTLPNADAGHDFVVPVYSQVTLGGNPTSSGLVSYSWAPSFYLSDPSIANPVASNTINMVFTVTITDEKGCIASDSILVSLYPELNVSSGFSPNNDGKNDLWIIDYIDQFPDNTVQIFNRWGDELFASKGYQTPFDGKFKGKDLPVGTYYYVINLNHPGYPKPITGPLTIFR